MRQLEGDESVMRELEQNTLRIGVLLAGGDGSHYLRS